jgi:hypothetical protein
MPVKFAGNHVLSFFLMEGNLNINVYSRNILPFGSKRQNLKLNHTKIKGDEKNMVFDVHDDLIVINAENQEVYEKGSIKGIRLVITRANSEEQIIVQMLFPIKGNGKKTPKSPLQLDYKLGNLIPKKEEIKRIGSYLIDNIELE